MKVTPAHKTLAPVAQVELVTCVADVSDSLDGTYFQLSDEDGTVGVWFDVAGGTTIPGGASALDQAIEVTGVVTDDTATAVATAVTTVINADSKFSATSSGAVITVTHATAGDVADGEDGDAGFTFAVKTDGKTDFEIKGAKWIRIDPVTQDCTVNGATLGASDAALEIPAGDETLEATIGTTVGGTVEVWWTKQTHN